MDKFKLIYLHLLEEAKYDSDYWRRIDTYKKIEIYIRKDNHLLTRLNTRYTNISITNVIRIVQKFIKEQLRNNDNIFRIKDTLNTWGDISGLHKKFTREASRVNYKKAIFFYFITFFQYVNGKKGVRIKRFLTSVKPNLYSPASKSLNSSVHDLFHKCMPCVLGFWYEYTSFKSKSCKNGKFKILQIDNIIQKYNQCI